MVFRVTIVLTLQQPLHKDRVSQTGCLLIAPEGVPTLGELGAGQLGVFKPLLKVNPRG